MRSGAELQARSLPELELAVFFERRWQRRMSSEHTAIEVGIEQLRAVLPQIGRALIVLADRRYCAGYVRYPSAKFDL